MDSVRPSIPTSFHPCSLYLDIFSKTIEATDLVTPHLQDPIASLRQAHQQRPMAVCGHLTQRRTGVGEAKDPTDFQATILDF